MKGGGIDKPPFLKGLYYPLLMKLYIVDGE